MNSTTDIIVADTGLPPAFGGSAPRSLAQLRQTIRTMFDDWLAKTEAQRTRIAYRLDVEQFLEHLGINAQHIEHMTRILPADVTAWRDHLLRAGGRPDPDGNPQPASNATVARKLTALRSFFSFLQSYGYRGANPAHPDFVKAPKVPDKGTTPSIHPKLVAKLLDCPDAETSVGVRDRAILAVFAYMALRVDEIHHINVGNIIRDGEHTIIKIKGKGNEQRRGVIPPVAARTVTDWIDQAAIEQDRSGPLFRPGKSARGLGRDGFKRSKMTVRAIQLLVKKHCHKVGIDQAVSVHSMRVTAATEAYKAGIQLVDIQHWLGHKDPRTTLRYIRGGENLDRSPAYTIRYA